MTTDMTRTQTAIDRLNKSLAKSSLDDLVTSRTKRSLLLVDCSHSMTTMTSSGERRIDRLRKVVTDLQSTRRVPLAAFGIDDARDGVMVVEVVPPAHGGCTPMVEAIRFGHAQGATHLVIVTDGEPDSPIDTLAAGRAFGGAVDVFFVGDPGTKGEAFTRELAAMTGGTAHTADLGRPTRELVGKVTLLLGSGDEAI